MTRHTSKPFVPGARRKLHANDKVTARECLHLVALAVKSYDDSRWHRRVQRWLSSKLNRKSAVVGSIAPDAAARD